VKVSFADWMSAGLLVVAILEFIRKAVREHGRKKKRRPPDW